MSIVQSIKDHLLVARKNGGNDVPMISTILSEIEIVGKNNGKRETYDEEALYVIKKMVKNNKETIAMTSKEKAASYLTENNYLEQFMPIMVSTEHLKKAVDDIVSRIDNPNSKSMGIIMKELKVKFKGNYDGKLASIIAKEILASV